MENNHNMVKIGWTALIAVSLSSFIISLDSTFMNVAISNLVVDFNTTLSTVQLIIAVYALTMASLMLVGAKLQEVMGRKLWVGRIHSLQVRLFLVLELS